MTREFSSSRRRTTGEVPVFQMSHEWSHIRQGGGVSPFSQQEAKQKENREEKERSSISKETRRVGKSKQKCPPRTRRPSFFSFFSLSTGSRDNTPDTREETKDFPSNAQGSESFRAESSIAGQELLALTGQMLLSSGGGQFTKQKTRGKWLTHHLQLLIGK